MELNRTVQCPPMQWENMEEETRRREVRKPSKWFIPIVIGVNTLYLILGAFWQKQSWWEFLTGFSDSAYVSLWAVNGTDFILLCKPWQGFTFLPLHAGLINLVPNLITMVSLTFVMYPCFNFKELFLLGAFSAFGSAVMINTDSYTAKVLIGASAACAGLIGGYIGQLVSNHPEMTESKVVAAIMVAGNLLIQGLMCIHPAISFPLSIISMLFGFILSVISLNCPIIRRWDQASPFTNWRRKIFVLGSIMWSVGFIIGCYNISGMKCWQHEPPAGVGGSI